MGCIFNLNRVELNFYLDKLAADEYITVNRTAGLDMVYSLRNMSAQDVISAYYKNRQTLLKDEDR